MTTYVAHRGGSRFHSVMHRLAASRQLMNDEESMTDKQCNTDATAGGGDASEEAAARRSADGPISPVATEADKGIAGEDG